MSVLVDPDGMREVILQSILKLKQQLVNIKAGYNSVIKSLQSESEDFAQLHNVIMEIDRELDYINKVMFKCERFIDDAIFEYVSTKKKVMDIYEKIGTLEMLRSENSYNTSHLNEYTNRLSKRLMQRREVESCKLPSKNSFINAPVRTGKIDNGNNIIIKTWSVSG